MQCRLLSKTHQGDLNKHFLLDILFVFFVSAETGSWMCSSYSCGEVLHTLVLSLPVFMVLLGFFFFLIGQLKNDIM